MNMERRVSTAVSIKHSSIASDFLSHYPVLQMEQLVWFFGSIMASHIKKSRVEFEKEVIRRTDYWLVSNLPASI